MWEEARFGSILVLENDEHFPFPNLASVSRILVLAAYNLV